MNKSQKLIFLLNSIFEKLLNPDDNYNDKLVSKRSAHYGGTYYKSDKDFAKSTHKKLSKEAAKYLDPNDLTSDKAKAVDDYKDYAYHNMNSILRHNKLKMNNPDYGTEKDIKEKITNLKSLTKNPTKHEFYAYRGIDTTKISNLEKNNTVHDKGFVSTSLRPETASNFGTSYGRTKKENTKLFRIHVTPGTKGHYVSGHASEDDDPMEAEFVLHPNTKFRVGDNHKTLRGHTFTDLHIHSQEDD